MTEIEVPPLNAKMKMDKPTVQCKLSQGFGIWAHDTFDCFCVYHAHLKNNGGDPSKTPVLFMLCCRAIELALKARYPENTTNHEFKKIGHDLEKAYNKLQEMHKAGQPSLSDEEKKLMQQANRIYSAKNKDFDYPNLFVTETPCDILLWYTRFPDLDALAALAQKIVEYTRY